MKQIFGAGYAAGRKLVVAAVGAGLLLVGVAMIVLPGPALLMIPLGLGLLAAEFAWARRWLERLRREARRLAERLGVRAV